MGCVWVYMQKVELRYWWEYVEYWWEYVYMWVYMQKVELRYWWQCVDEKTGIN